MLHKDDYLEFTDEGKLYLCRIAGYSATNQCIDVKPIYAVKDCFDWINSTNEAMLTGYWKASTGHNFVATNILFSKLQAHIITVSPIGKVYKK